MNYKETVRRITDLRWELAETADLLALMILSTYAAREFAESLRIALTENQGVTAFQEMAAGELETTNLQFADYTGPGDHADFLWHFIEKHAVLRKCPMYVRDAGFRYRQQVQAMSNETRVMSIISRKQELPSIFTSILKARGWDELPELQAFKYYLEQHIALDSGEGWHADLLSGFEVNDSVLPFYEARLNMYRVLPSLWQTR